jgi:hypothetical protein
MQFEAALNGFYFNHGKCLAFLIAVINYAMHAGGTVDSNGDTSALKKYLVEVCKTKNWQINDLNLATTVFSLFFQLQHTPLLAHLNTWAKTRWPSEMVFVHC